ncbi:MAG: DUF362 domain-containing protein [Eubacteriales bacterium]
MKSKNNKAAFIITIIILTAILGANIFSIISCKSDDGPSSADTTAETSVIADQTNEFEQAEEVRALGEGVGVNPGRVVWSHNPDSVDWNGSGYWWNINNFNQDVIQSMVDNSIITLAGKDNVNQAWEALFKYHNNGRGKGETGYKEGEKIAIKLNMNGVGDSKGQSDSGFSTPASIRALLLSMVRYAGVKPSDITLFDASRVIPDYMQTLCGSDELEGVNFKYRDEGGKNDCVADTSFPLVWSADFEGETCYLPTCLTEAEYLINFASLKGHDLAGVTLSAKNHFGTIMNSSRTNPPQAANIHGIITANDYNGGEGWTWERRPMNTYTVLTDFTANKHIGQKTVLYLLDAFICAPTQGSNISGDMKWKSAPFNNDWPSSIFMSQDPVALDSVGVDFLMNEPSVAKFDLFREGTTHENYLIESALAGSPPSGTVYKNGDGKTVSSLGTYEHWNNASDKQYSRNLGKDYGIELVAVK